LPKYSPLHQQALRFIAEHSDLCDLLMRRCADLAFCLDNAEHLREVVTRLVLSLRRAIKEFANREVCDEKRLLKSVSAILRHQAGLQGHAGQLLRRCSKRAWKLEQLYGETNFEADIVDENLLPVLRLYRSVDGAVKLRNGMRALARHYASLIGTSGAARFLRDLAGELDA
jgi:hypothetical protein